MNHGNGTPEDDQRLYIERLEAIEKAARVFLVTVDELTPAITAAFLTQQIHGVTYRGPNWVVEQDALKTALEANR